MPTLITRCGCRRLGAGPLEAVDADVGEHDRQPRVGVERLRGDAGEALPHALARSCVHHARRRRAAGRARAASIARSSASWSLACARRGRPALAREARRRCRRASRRSRWSCRRRSRSSRSRPMRPASAMASWFEPSASSPSPSTQITRGAPRPVARSASARPTAIGRPCPSDPLAISTPGDQRAVGVMPERRVEAPEARQRVDRDEALGGEHGVERRRAVALGEQQPVALGIVGGIGRHVEDAVVEHPVDVERRGGARVVLGVAAQQLEQTGQVLVAELHERRRCSRGHASDATISSALEVKQYS